MHFSRQLINLDDTIKIIRMKKFVYLFIAGAFVLSSCSKSDDTTETPTPTSNPQVAVEKKNTALVQGFFSTKNTECGEWGWTMKEELITYGNSNNAIFMGTYPQGPQNEGFMTSEGNQMELKWLVETYPIFAVNGELRTSRSAGTVNVAGETVLCKRAIDDHKAAAVVANTGAKYTVADGKIKITASAKFFAAASGTYSVAFYVVENNAMWKQAGKSDTDIAHQSVLRASANGTWGETVFTGNIAADTFKDLNAEIAVDSSWNTNNISVYAVIWKLEGSTYKMVNASVATR